MLLHPVSPKHPVLPAWAQVMMQKHRIVGFDQRPISCVKGPCSIFVHIEKRVLKVMRQKLEAAAHPHPVPHRKPIVSTLIPKKGRRGSIQIPRPKGQ